MGHQGDHPWLPEVPAANPACFFGRGELPLRSELLKLFSRGSGKARVIEGELARDSPDFALSSVGRLWL